jgi:hypothetical protein
MRILMLIAIILLGTTSVLAEPKGKGRAPCEALKSAPACTAKAGCAWVPVGQGANFKCHTLKATPR